MSPRKNSLARTSRKDGSALDGWLLHYFLLLAIGVVVVFIAALPVGKILLYHRQASEMRTEAARLRYEAERLRENALQARSPAAIEKIARESLGLSKPGEVVFVPVEGPFPEPAQLTSQQTAQKSKAQPKIVAKPRPTPKPSPSPTSSPRPPKSR